MNTTNHRFRLSITALALLLSTLTPQLSTVLAQGPLAPPGAPAPTMKTLDQIEPRIPLVVGAPGVTTEASYHFVISQRGSYYLTGNLDVTKTNGIDIRAEGVTLDLMGFEIRRTAGSAGGFGIEVDATSHRYTIKNGSITGGAIGFNRGIACLPSSGSRVRSGLLIELAVSGATGAGIDGGDGCHIDRCVAHGNSFAIIAGVGSTMTNCTAYGNQGTYAISADDGSTLTNCTAYGNQVTSSAIRADVGSTLTNCTAQANDCIEGIAAGEGSTIANCTARANTSSGTFSYGIRGLNRCTIIGCTSSNNTSTNATLTGLTGMGISGGIGSLIKDCTAAGNLGDGIRVDRRCAVIGNNCFGNGGGISGAGDGAGIHSITQSNRIEGNTVTENDRGIDVDDTFSLIIKNTAAINTTNYAIAASNAVGPIVNVAAVGDISGTANADHPAANFSY